MYIASLPIFNTVHLTNIAIIILAEIKISTRFDIHVVLMFFERLYKGALITKDTFQSILINSKHIENVSAFLYL